MEETNSQNASSQPTVADSGAVGTNDSANQTAGMSETQSSDYYNKTQQLAQERREFESARSDFERQRQDFMSQYGKNVHYGQQPASQAPQQPAYSNPYQTYKQLVDAVGEEAANVLLGQQHQLANAANQQIQQLNQSLYNLEYNTLINSIEAKGSRLYGEAWQSKSKEVMDLVKQFPGLKVEQAWNAIVGASAKQDGIDEAYKNQAQKVQANVGSQQVQPQQTQRQISSIDDALAAAMDELATA